MEITEQERQNHEIHLLQAERMSSMMHYWEKHCLAKVQTSRKKADIDVNEDIPTCDDMVARISTDMLQVQSVPRLQESISYYKSKVNEISTQNK